VAGDITNSDKSLVEKGYKILEEKAASAYSISYKINLFENV